MSAYPVTLGLRSLGVGHGEAVGGSLCAPCNWAAVSLPDCVPGGCVVVRWCSSPDASQGESGWVIVSVNVVCVWGCTVGCWGLPPSVVLWFIVLLCVLPLPW